MPLDLLLLQGDLGHLSGALECLVATDEAGSMTKGASLNAGDLGEIFITDAAPFLRQAEAILKATALHRHSLNTPHTGNVGVQHKLDERIDVVDLFQLVQMAAPGQTTALELDDLAALVDVLAGEQGPFDKGTGRDVRFHHLAEDGEKALAAHSTGNLKPFVLVGTLPGGFINFIPARIDTAHPRRQASAILVQHLGALGILLDTGVDGIDGLHEG
mmetsp:Transcript_24223/g.56836  ORF Transcript_24223/g.56836 Transcript_24223/m.56836 type:complete len:216 (+) Transcript_24223:62-709(+)